MDRYTYLLLGLFLVVPLIGLVSMRKDLARLIAKVGIIGGVAGLLAEIFYFKDYWRPPSLFGVASISAEDFIFGFGITALSFSAYLWLFKVRLSEQVHPPRHALYGIFFVAGCVAMLFFNSYLGINSIFVSSAAFLLLTAVIMYLRRDLIRPGIYSAILITGFMGMAYIILFDVISPHFWDNYWLLADTKWGITIFGNVPVTELVWYASWVVFVSVSYPFISGRNIQPINWHSA